MNAKISSRELDLDRRIALNQVRLRCTDADRGSLEVKSTFDRTERMEHRTDEAISFTDDDLVIIKNRRESPCTITLETIRVPNSAGIVCRPSRQGSFQLRSREDSEIATKRTVTLGGGEALTISSSVWRPRQRGGTYTGAV